MDTEKVYYKGSMTFSGCAHFVNKVDEELLGIYADILFYGRSFK